ncbi:hypothetical protein BGX27_006833 [Mortierella sp. AM989]|nr:hypothetical protein BGX27_006833 [Mortierella sp. AM989]
MATRFLTSIPSTQPSCGQLTVDSPTPQCKTNASEAMGCFIQPTGLYCAPLSSTRGFLYTLDNYPTNSDNGSAGTITPRINLIPKLSTVFAVNGTNDSLDISGQPVLTQGPALLGQACVAIPLPPQNDPAWSFLVTMANKRLNEIVGSPGIGAGSDALSLRGDCEPTSYCNFSQPQNSTARQGVCREQLPNYHSCTSYIECISLRCDNMGNESTKTTHKKRRLEEHRWRKRRVGMVCLPSSSNVPNGGLEVDHDDGSSRGTSFPMWSVALIVIAVLGGAVLAFLLIKRRKQQLTASLKGAGLPHQIRPSMERIRERERERIMSSSTQLYPTSSSSTRISSTLDGNSKAPKS